MVNVCSELGILKGWLTPLSQTMRDYRNLVHPANELRTKAKFSEYEASFAYQFVAMLHRQGM